MPPQGTGASAPCVGLHGSSLPPTAQVVLVSRRSAKRGRVTRRISNEAELMESLSAIPGCSAQLLDLASLSLQGQLELIASTDILIGGDALRPQTLWWHRFPSGLCLPLMAVASPCSSIT